MCMKFRTFWNLEYPDLIMSEIIHFKRVGYLNVLDVLLQNTIR